ncbi:MAG: putative aliphatic sulfonates transport permease protein SsuC [Syntrophorhabdaceae bacterium PtaU1.Bin034]|nr:MAG: putative aliphatic sulfonates transport permease protein SsuC [Syntrophorhabdaceae bacterium PtaU1.Bin034]
MDISSDKERKARSRTVRPGIVNYLLCLGILVLLWKLAASALSAPFLLAPEDVLLNFARACATADFWEHFLVSTYRVVAGIFLGWSLAFPVGVMMGYGKRLDSVFAPLVFITYPIPKIVLLPIILLIFGLGDLSKIVLITSILFFQVLVATRDGVKAIDEKHYDSLKSLGADNRVMLREIAFPAALPHSFTALRIGIGTAISVLFFVESFATTNGLGYLIMDAWARVDYNQLFTGIVGMGALGIVLYEALNVIEPRICAWKYAERTETPEDVVSDAIAKVRFRTMMYGRMIKFEHTVFALPFALAALLLAMRQSAVAFSQFFWIIMAMVGARSAAMGFNRLVDARIDARNPRTADRELPSGRMTVKETKIFIAVSSLLFILSSLFISYTCFWCSFVVLAFLFGYSYTKRFTWLSHLALGTAIGLAPLGVWVAITNSLSLRIVILSIALCTYIAGFDILYACQDMEFDRKEGLCSMPAKFGARKAMHVSRLLHVVAFVSLLSLFRLFGLTPVYLGFVLAIGVLLVIEHRLVSPADLSRINMAFYRINSVISILLFAALLMEELLRRLA